MPIDFRAYPPADHVLRVKDYERYEKLFLGQHRELYAPGVPGKFQLRRYIVANFAGVISRLSADLLFGEQPDFLMPEDVQGAQEALDNLIARNNLHTTNYESALANSFRGDAVYKVRWGKRTPQSEQPEAIIEEIPPTIYFPELSEDDVRQVLRVTLAWPKTDPLDRQKRYLRIEEHEPGLIRNRLLRLGGGGDELPLETLEAYKDLEPEVETGLDHIPIFHVPNFVYGSRYWGVSDYKDLEPLFEALDERLSQTDEVMTKHVAPKLVLPPRFINEDGTVNLSELEVVQLEAGEQAPTYVTWDAHLSAAQAHTDRLIDLIFIMSETAPVAFGLEKYGTAQSGTALRLRLLRTLAKINRKRLYYDRALKAALLCAQQLEVIHGGAAYEPAEPTIQWADGLPEDLTEMVQTEMQRLAAGNTSIESSVRRLDGPDAVEAEMGRIAEETGQAVALTGAPGAGRGQAPQPSQGAAEGTPAQGSPGGRGIEVDQTPR